MARKSWGVGKEGVIPCLPSASPISSRRALCLQVDLLCYRGIFLLTNRIPSFVSGLTHIEFLVLCRASLIKVVFQPLTQ